MDLALQRQFHLTEKMGLTFRGEFFNILNHPNFGSPNNTLSSPLFGYSTQMLASSLAGAENAGFNPLYQIGGPRSTQLALKLLFLMDEPLTKTRGGKKGQIRSMIRFCVSFQRHG